MDDFKQWKRYPKYKDSGVEWLGIIPESWEVKSIKRLSLIKRGASPRPIDDPIYFDDNGEYVWVRISDVTSSNKYLLQSEQKLSELGKSKSVALEAGELFLSICATVGKPIITKVKCCIHDGFVYFPNLKESREYLFYIFLGGELYKGLGKMGTQLNLNTDTVGEIKIPIPPFLEQEKIAKFLDKETAKIDNLINKKQRLIELFQEKRTAIISHAVTKGLNLDVPMKDSGVEWLRMIPESWEVKRLKFITRLSYGDSLPNELREEGDIFVYGSNGIVGTHNIANTLYPCIVVGRKGSYGKVTYSDTSVFAIDTTYFIDTKAAQIEFDFRWLFYSLLLLKLDTNSQDIGVPGLSREFAYNQWLPFPNFYEQQEIAEYLDIQTQKIDTLINKTQTSIEYLKEYRTVLISAAVTGKIDVREEMQLS